MTCPGCNPPFTGITCVITCILLLFGTLCCQHSDLCYRHFLTTCRCGFTFQLDRHWNARCNSINGHLMLASESPVTSRPNLSCHINRFTDWYKTKVLVSLANYILHYNCTEAKCFYTPGIFILLRLKVTPVCERSRCSRALSARPHLGLGLLIL